MISYGFGILPLIYELQVAHPRVTQPWYANKNGCGGSFSDTQIHLDEILVKSLPRGYLPDPTKTILIISERDI